jgi:hypothetical protein
MNGFKFPGVVWAALLVALPMLSMWLEQYFPGALWAAPVAGLLLIAAKVIEVVAAGADVQLPEDAVGDWQWTEERPNVWWG